MSEHASQGKRGTGTTDAFIGGACGHEKAEGTRRPATHPGDTPAAGARHALDTKWPVPYD